MRKPAIKTGKLTRSPEALTMALLRDLGWVAEKCSWWEAHTKHRRDLFGFADLIAFTDDNVVLVQATSWSNMSNRMRKIEKSLTAHLWVTELRHIWVVGWRHVLRTGPQCRTYSMVCYRDKWLWILRG